MEITIIHGQAHKGSTYHITAMIKERLVDSDTVVHEYFMPKDAPAFCVGCYQCIQKGEEYCPQADKVQKILASMLRSKIILIDSPTYCFEMSGQLKTLLLTLFSDRGYEGVSMRDIACAVGIKAASLYNHFKSKEDIFNSIIAEMSTRYEQAVLKMQVPHGDMDAVAEEYMHVSEETLVMIAKNMFLYFLKDDFASKFRKMLTIEQFRSTQVTSVFQNYFIDGAIIIEKILFGNMIKQGAFIECDPYVMALHFYSPIFLLLSKFDRLPDKTDETIDILVKHVKQFSAIYSRHVG